MKKHLINTAIIIAIATTQSVSANQASFESLDNNSQEKQAMYKQPTVIGFGSGLVAGAIIAGPIGAVVAGTIGLFIGNAEEIDEKRQVAQKSLEQSQEQLSVMTSKKHHLISKLTQAEQQNDRLTQKLQLANNTLNIAENLDKLKLNLQFNVNSSELEGFYQEQVSHLALLIKNNPDLQIQLFGYADRNGETTNNLALSEKRVAAVKALLIEQGITEHNISTQALGENSPILAEQSVQNDFYDRRVEIQLIQAPIANIATTPVAPTATLTAGN